MRLRLFEGDLSLQAEYLLNASYFGDYFKDTLLSVVPDKESALKVRDSSINHLVNYMDVSRTEATSMVDNLINDVYK